MEYLILSSSIFDNHNYIGNGKDKVVIITGWDSELGRATVVALLKKELN